MHFLNRLKGPFQGLLMTVESQTKKEKAKKKEYNNNKKKNEKKTMKRRRGRKIRQKGRTRIACVQTFPLLQEK